MPLFVPPSALTGPVEVKLRRVANQSIANNSVVAIDWDTEDADAFGFITVTSGTLTVPAGLGGLYIVTASVFTVTLAARALTDLVLGGTSFRVSNGAQERTWANTVTWRLAAGATIVLNVFQLSGSTLDFTANFTAIRVAA